MDEHVWKDPRIVAGTNRLLMKLDEVQNGGSQLGGWKLGLGAPAARNKFQITAPVVGYLLQENFVRPDTSVDISSLVNPMAEAEIAVYFRSEVHPDCPHEDLLQNIEAIGSAIEIVDVDASTDNLEAILAKNIYQRRVVLAPLVSNWNAANVERSPATVWLNDVPVHEVPDSVALTGRMLDNIQHTARCLRAFNRIIGSGQVLILGAIAPPLSLRDARTVRISVGGLAPLGIELQR